MEEDGDYLALVINLVLCDESEEDSRMMIGRFAEVSKRKNLKVNTHKNEGCCCGVGRWIRM